jgi:hypothetical protein
MSTGSIETTRPEELRTPRRGWRTRWRWWLRVAEIRLRFVLLGLIALAVITQWERLRNVWERGRYAASGPAASSVAGDTEYFCPMDPGVLSAWPAICPICNMDLVQRQKHDAPLLPEGVVARMQLSPYRVQLAGIRTTEVTPDPLWHEIPVAGRLEVDSSKDRPAAEAVLCFDAVVSPSDHPFLRAAREAIVTSTNGAAAPATALLNEIDENEAPDVPRVHVRLSDQAGFAAGMFVRATIRISAGALEPAGSSQVLSVPQSSVVDHGDRQFVFVESMPGQFDAVPVRLGRRCGGRYPVLSGLRAGQRVATAGAFLIDAETRLNPSLAIAYFGANSASEASRAPEVRMTSRTRTRSASPLTAEQAALAAQQRICPVTELPLDSMGGPVPVIVEGRTVFLCCKACERKLRSDPAKYLSRLTGDDRSTH